MFASLKKVAFQFASSQIKDFTCPKCGLTFAPFKDHDLTSFSDDVVCPKCDFTMPFKAAMATQAEVKANPPGPCERPEGSRIERKVVSATELLFYIPATGSSRGLLFLGGLCSVISLTVFLFILSKDPDWKPLTLSTAFIAVGAGLVYAGFRMAFAVHLLYLSPERIRLQRQLFKRSKNFDLTTSRLTTVKKAEFYQENYKPVYGLLIASPEGKIRFGSTLMEEEKNWLRWEIREFVKDYAPGLI